MDKLYSSLKRKAFLYPGSIEENLWRAARLNPDFFNFIFWNRILFRAIEPSSKSGNGYDYVGYSTNQGCSVSNNTFYYSCSKNRFASVNDSKFLIFGTSSCSVSGEQDD